MLRIPRGTAFAIVLGLVAFAAPTRTDAQSIDPELWVTNGPVHALARHGETVYMGGSFTEMSPPTGSGVVFNPTTGDTVVGFPRVVGRVYAVTSDLAGGYYIGGLFTSVGGQPRRNIAHVTSSLTVSAWNPGANDAVVALSPSLHGTVYAGGSFGVIGGLPRERIAEIDAGGNVLAWNPGASSTVRAIAPISGSVYIAGDFTFAGGQSRTRVARLNGTTGAAEAWNPGVNGAVHCLEIGIQGPPESPTVTILVGGTFTTAGGQARANLAEFTTAGAATAWNPSPNGAVYDIQERNVIYVGGAFTAIAGQNRNRAAALDPVTAAAQPWNPNANGTVRALGWSSFHVHLAGEFTEVGGQPARRLARVTEAAGTPVAFAAEANEAVFALCLSTPGLYAGGQFTGLSGVPRRNLAALDTRTGRPTTWTPDPDGTVRALVGSGVGPVLYTLYAGGDFSNVAGFPRRGLVEFDAVHGNPTSFDIGVGPTGSAFALALVESVLYVGGSFPSFDGSGLENAAAVNVRTREVLYDWNPFPDGPVFAIAASPTAIYLGGSFTEIFFVNRERLAAVHPGTGVLLNWYPFPDAAVRALLVDGSTIYAGGDFNGIGGQARSRIGAVGTNGLATSFDPSANGVVRALARREGGGVVAGGDFTVVGGQPRARIASIPADGTVDGWIANVSDREVLALAVKGPTVVAGGTFAGIGTDPQGNVSLLDTSIPAPCPPLGPDTWFAGPSPRSIASLDFDQDGIRDLAVTLLGDATTPPYVAVMRGGGSGGVWNGSFSIANTLPLYAWPVAVEIADFDADGLDDIAAAQTYDIGQVMIYRNTGGGGFAHQTTVDAFGRIGDFDVKDMDSDGILDLVVALVDSASTPLQGGVEVLRGGGAGGAWNGTFLTPPDRDSWLPTAANDLVAHDFNGDGNPDVVFTTNTAYSVLRYRAGGTPAAIEIGVTGLGFVESGTAIVHGDLDDDGKSDRVNATQTRRVQIGRNTSTLDPFDILSRFFHSSAAPPKIHLPSVARDLALADFDQDGNLDLVVSQDSLGIVEFHPGLDSAGVSNARFGSPVQLAAIDAGALIAEDFDGDGAPDIAVVQPHCGTVTVIRSGALATLPLGLVVTSPNGGEIWPDEAQAPPSQAGSAVAVLEGDTEASPAEASQAEPSHATQSGPTPELTATRFITWTKGPGIQGVDVDVSRDGGATWQTIGENVAGTEMRWIVTPPTTASALIRVREHGIPSRNDQSDAVFTIPATTTDAADQPATLAFHGLHANPARGGNVRFRLDAPHALAARVTIYDAAGRTIRTLLNDTVPAGTHALTWDGRTTQGRATARGIYFVRAQAGPLDVTRKVVLLD